MAITEDERHLVYEVLGIPNRTSVLNVNGDYGTGAKFQNHAVLTAKTEIDAILDGLDTAPEARLRELLVEWRKVSTAGVKLKPVASNQGVDRNPSRERGLIRRRIRSVLGVLVESTSSGAALPLA